MANLEQQPSPSAQDAPELSAHGASRRRFAIASAGVSGVILTLASQPGIAGTVRTCTTPSGFASVHWDSHSPGSSFIGHSPGYWKTHPEEMQKWINPAVLFGNVFSCHTPLKDCPVSDVVAHINDAKTNDKYNVGMHIVAAYLNVKAGQVKVLNEEKVLDIYREYDANGSFVPTYGAPPWNGCQIVEYLKSTMDADPSDPGCIS